MKFKIKDSYDRAILATRVRAFIDLIRPFTLLAPFIGGFVFGFVAMDQAGSKFNWSNFLKLLYGAVTLSLLNGGSNSINQATDSEMDKVNKPYRPIPLGVLSENEAYSFGLVLWVIAWLRGFLINLTFFVACVFITFCAYLYSDGPQLKKKYILNNLIIAISRGFLGPLAGWSIFGNVFDKTILAICSVFFIYIFGTTIFKDIPDIEGDELCGVRNFVIVNGVKKSLIIAISCMTIVHLQIELFIAVGIFEPIYRFVHFIGLFTVAIAYISFSNKDSESLIENNRSWVFMYMQMISMMIIFAVVIVL